jgi:dipeptidyl aminopeptidase/acylaminoacyl peptidase
MTRACGKEIMRSSSLPDRGTMGAAPHGSRHNGMNNDRVALTAELITDSAVAAQPAISPDGRWVAYLVAPAGRPGGRALAALWLAASDGSAAPRPLTDGTAADRAPRWAPDSGSLTFISDRTGAAQLHRIRPDSGAAETLTSWDGGISVAIPLAGAGLAVVAADEPAPPEQRRTADRDEPIIWAQRVPPDRLRLLDPATGGLRRVAGLGDRHVVALEQRPDGGQLAVLSWVCPEIDPGELTSELHVVDPATGTVRDLGRTAPEAGSLTWWLAGDGWHLAYLARPRPNGGSAVFDVAATATAEAGTDAETEAGAGAGAAEHRDLTTGLAQCPAALASAGGGPPLALFADGLDTAIFRLDPGRRRFRRLSTLRGLADELTASRSGDLVAALASAPGEPLDVHAGPPGGPLTRLSDTRPILRQVRWGAQERLSYQASDGLGLDGLLILPPGRSRADGPFPLVTLLHGGPYGRFADQLMLDPHAPGQWLAAAGYAVFLPNPRGGQGHGHDFAAAATGTIGAGDWTDILRGIDLLIAGGVADPGRLGISGWSHGGFLAAWAVGQTDRFAAAVMGAGVSDWGMLVATGEAGRLEADLGGSCGWEGPGPYPHDQISPVSFAARVATPVLILHGEDDTNVPLGQAIYFHRALSHFGIEHELIVYPREGHGVAERGHQHDLLRRTLAWFDRWLTEPGS